MSGWRSGRRWSAAFSPLVLALAVLSATALLPRKLRPLCVSHVPDDPPVRSYC